MVFMGLGGRSKSHALLFKFPGRPSLCIIYVSCEPFLCIMTIIIYVLSEVLAQ